MNRREILASAGLVSLSAVVGHTAEPPSPDADPWVGKYLKYGRYDSMRTGQFGEAQTITITKDPEGYSLGEPHSHRHFSEVKKGVLSDGKGGLGTIYLGSAEYADGKKVPILRAEFCYEEFVLYRDSLNDHASKAESREK